MKKNIKKKKNLKREMSYDKKNAEKWRILLIEISLIQRSDNYGKKKM